MVSWALSAVVVRRDEPPRALRRARCCPAPSGHWEHEAPCTYLVITAAAEDYDTSAALDGVPAEYWLYRAPGARRLARAA